MAFDPDDLAALATAREVRLGTQVAGGPRYVLAKPPVLQ